MVFVPLNDIAMALYAMLSVLLSVTVLDENNTNLLLKASNDRDFGKIKGLGIIIGKGPGHISPKKN